MTKSTSPILLAKTSALVLVCDSNYSYQSPKTKEFLSYLDLSEGENMYNKIKYLKPHVDEVIPNRKFIIHNYIREVLMSCKDTVQVLVLACGWDPILVKINEEFPTHSVFGVDIESVHLQEKILQQIAPDSSIFYINSDITDTQSLMEKLIQKGWVEDRPSFIVLEGISYYIKPKQLWHILQELRAKISSECFICGDFLVDWKQQKLSKISQHLATGVFDMIKEECSQKYYPYTTLQIQKKLESLGFDEIKFFTQDAIQTKRLGRAYPWDLKDGHIQLFTAQNIIS